MIERIVERFYGGKNRHGFRTDRFLRYLLRRLILNNEADTDIIARKVVEAYSIRKALHYDDYDLIIKNFLVFKQ